MGLLTYSGSHPGLHEALSYLALEEKEKEEGEEGEDEELFPGRIRREMGWEPSREEHCHTEGDCGSVPPELCM